MRVSKIKAVCLCFRLSVMIIGWTNTKEEQNAIEKARETLEDRERKKQEAEQQEKELQKVKEEKY
ncbi:hypothetical protein CQZ94_29940 [Bacillus sp. MYb209]|uniref:hypothetical protein n=1 Tax=Bacillus sp. MYb209 TaxID=1848605 RepID=UPI000CFDA8E3|nr:hypothetical protein [Bacillus sp. MYb209]PQZ45247.1 hypothetical protein CQZ94_29940 [Bacillus sp. MYb209]